MVPQEEAEEIQALQEEAFFEIGQRSLAAPRGVALPNMFPVK